jgi:GxxExxY protein
MQHRKPGLDEITHDVIDNAIEIHRRFGPGLIESVYDSVLARALERDGYWVQAQQSVRFEYDGLIFRDAFRVDQVVNGVVLVEIKSVEKLAVIHSKQVLTYLRLMKLPLGLLINFGEPTLAQGLRRIVNNLPPGDSPVLRVNRIPSIPPGETSDQ